MDEALMEEVFAALLRKDSSLAAQVLSEFLQEDDQKKLQLALREMTKAFGGVSALEAQAGLNLGQLDRQLSSDGTLLISTLSTILKIMGMKFRVSSLQ